MSRRSDAVRTVLRGTGQALITVGLVLLLFCVYELKITNLVTARAQEQLADDLRAQWDAPAAAPASTPAPSPTAVAPPTATPTVPPAPSPSPSPVTVPPVELGSGVAVLRIPRLGDWNDHPPVVVEGVSTRDLKRGPGHIPGTALPGEVGNVVLSGHRTTYGAPFRNIDQLKPQQVITIDMPDGRFVYRVEETKIVDDQDLSVLDPVGHQRLMLSACHPLYSAAERVIVFARLVHRGPPRVRRS